MSSKNPTKNENKGVEKQGSTVVEMNISDTDFTGLRIVHEGYPKDSIVQNIVNYAYKLGGYDFMAVLECEASYGLDQLGDNGHAHGICQINDLYHKDIPAEYTTNWVVAVEYCYQKWKGGTKFYGPGRMIKGMRCSEYVKDRFTFTE